MINNLFNKQRKDNWLLKKSLTYNFITISILFERCREQFTGQDLAKILKILTDHEVVPGGPYFNENKEIDLTTNIAIAYFLSLNEVYLPNLDNLIKNAPTLSNLDKYLLLKLNQTSVIPQEKNKDDDLMINKILIAAQNRFKDLDVDLKKLL